MHPPRKHADKHFLLQVFAAMGIAQHSSAEPKTWLLPTCNQASEGMVIVLCLDSPHRLLVRHREQRRQKFASSHALSRFHANCKHIRSPSCLTVARTPTARFVQEVKRWNQRFLRRKIDL